jgi:hypothetical protein
VRGQKSALVKKTWLDNIMSKTNFNFNITQQVTIKTYPCIAIYKSLFFQQASEGEVRQIKIYQLEWCISIFNTYHG